MTWANVGRKPFAPRPLGHSGEFTVATSKRSSTSPPVSKVRESQEAVARSEALHPSPRLAHHATDTAPLVASIARLIAELAEVRVISDRRADQLISQAETIGQLRAELAAAHAPQQ